MENTIGTQLGEIDGPMQACRRPQLVECKLEKVPKYNRKWLALEGKKNQSEISEAAPQEPFVMQELNHDFLHIQQRNVSML